ncbi:MAG: alpha-glucan family phosphorylase [Phycisphaerae bacterium]|nr:alpha-glucan family phosphorylase [Phycisphaerae bacterium]
MEIGLDPAIPTYSGGLGMLAGDSLRAAADLKLPMIALTLVHRRGYFYQRLDADGNQTEEPVDWVPADYLKRLEPRVTVTLEGRVVQIAAWQFDVTGVGGFQVPVILLDTDVPENAEGDRSLTNHLYGGDARYRLLQEAVLGIGGVRMLRALGFRDLERYHMNEGHAALLVLELLEEESRTRGGGSIGTDILDTVRRRCVFTTHTPVAAGHDKFPLDLVRNVLEPGLARILTSAEEQDALCCDNALNMTFLGFSLSHYINGVAKRHGEVSRQMFGHYPIDAITNGVHSATWAAPSIAELFDKHVPGWREDTASLRYAMSLNRDELWNAHQKAKRHLIEEVNRDTNAGFDLDVFTIGFARRATAYKRPDLALSNVDRLKRISREAGAFQLIYAGKAHPHDGQGKQLIRSIVGICRSLRPEIRAVYLPNHDMELSRLLVAGVDLWLNTPQPPMEASGTSGMKAAVNGVPSLSILDGWWLEGCIEGVTGWAIGDDPVKRNPDGSASPLPPDEARRRDADALYRKLEEVILPIFYRDRSGFVSVMRHAIAINGSFFNTRRMMQNYVTKAYFE